MSTQKKILVLGGTGLLGAYLVDHLKFLGFEVLVQGRSTGHFALDLSIRESVTKLLNQVKPNIIINLIAITDVDYCEMHPSQAYVMHGAIVGEISQWVNSRDAEHFLIQLSTDQLYDGDGEKSEEEITIGNYYTFSKYTGELMALSTRSCIVRTNFFGLSHTPTRISFTDWIFNNLSSRNEIVVLEDLLFSPVSISTLCRFIELIVRFQPIGVFNIGSKDGMSKADFASYFAKSLELDDRCLKKSRMCDVNFFKAFRPRDMRMNSHKFESVFDLKMPSLMHEIDSTIKSYYEKL